jgi:chloride channel protein, CIC family
MLMSWLARQSDRVFRPKQIAIVEACAIGLISALAAVSLKQSILWLEGWRVGLTGIYPAWLVLPLVGIVGGGLSGLLVERWAPEATGSGIPQVKAALGYVPIALDLRVAVVKWLGTCLSLGSGLVLGRQGPTVQIGAALAAQLSYWTNTSPTYQRQLIAAGAAAGLAASFNAPLAGVIFVIEELLQDLPDLTLGTAIIAAVVGGVVSLGLGGRGMIPDLSNVQLQFAIAEIPLLIVVGLLGGLVGAICNRSLLASLQFYHDRFHGRSLAVKIAVAGGITGIMTALLPDALQGSRDLKDFLAIGDIQWQTAAWILVSQFLMCLVAFGSTAPGGLLSPSLVLGAALGNLVATGIQSGYQSDLLPFNPILSSPTVYALTGMSAVFSAITRRPMMAIAIVWEMSAKFNLILPLMIGSVAAYLVAEQLFPDSIYQHLLARRGINIEQPNLADRRWEGLIAADIMQRRVETLASQMSIEEAIQAFARSHHRGFPIVDEGRLVGMLSQSDLAVLTAQVWDLSTPLSQIMTQRVITVTPQDPLTSILHLLDRHQVSRLPVIEGRKLVGIITRADIIHCEAERVSSNASFLKPQPNPSYLVYQTRSPATGKGRLLVPLSNPHTADTLLRLAAAIARERDYELECLCAIVIPHASSPAETAVDIGSSRQLLERAVAQGESWNIPVHTQIRVAHDPASTILETIKERHIDLLCMGWQGKTSTPGRIFGNIVDTAIRQAPCPVVLIKLGKNLQNISRFSANNELLTPQSTVEALLRLTSLNRWLVPISGGANIQYALQLLPGLISFSRDPEIYLCQFFDPDRTQPDLDKLNTAANFVREHLSISATILPLYSDAISATAIDLAAEKQCDAIILGASRESLLQQTIQGNIPEAIAQGSDCTVIVVRAEITESN